MSGERPARPYRLEACITSLAQALAARDGGADRLEICRDLDTGGLTPDLETVRSICAAVSIPVRVMIRETPVGFDAGESELTQMAAAIERFRDLPIEGFVLGVMQQDRVDLPALTRLLTAAHPLPVTFHKAIDTSRDLLADVMALNGFPGVDTLLSSGAAVTALAGIARLREMRDVFAGHLMAAGAITPDQLPALHAALGLGWYHGRAITGPAV